MPQTSPAGFISTYRTVERAAAAETLMHRLFAPPSTAIDGIDFAIAYRFAEHAGGDIADVFPSEGGRAWMSLTDIQGNGEEAAVHAACLKYGIRAYAALGRTPAQIVRDLNGYYMKDCAAERSDSFASVFLAQIDPSARAIRYVSAAHEALFLVHANGFIEHLRPTGPLVGILDDGQADYAEREIFIDSGATILAVSDGVTEARHRLKLFGLMRVEKAARESGTLHLDRMVRDVIEAAVLFVRGRVTDDMAAVALRIA